MAHGATTRT
jgi:hypothetical protein